jgi:glycosyltransferase involved in cell wall biosynthesis
LNSRITVAIPTYNRARFLRETLASIAALEIPSGISAECLIVDNDSTDDTNAVASAFARSAPIPTRIVVETRRGSSYARNCAVANTSSEFILFIDDDAIAEPGWAAELVSALERRNLDAACGMVIPRWSQAPPGWLGPSIYIKLAVHNVAAAIRTAPEALDTIHNYFSANVGFRRATFTRFGGFRQDLGVVGGNPMSGEDTELFERIMRGCGAIGFVPAARIHHLIPPERMTRAYLRRKSYAFGMGSAIAGGRTHNHLDKLGRNAVRLVLAALRGDSEGLVYHELECANFFGYWHGRLQQWRRRDPSIA